MGKRKVKLEIGKFYYAYGGGMHPAMVFEYDFVHKTYKSIKTGTTKAKDMIQIKPIQKGKQSFVHNRPFEGTRRDYGDKELVGLSFDESDKTLLEDIKRRRTRKTTRAKQRYKKMPPSD